MSRWDEACLPAVLLANRQYTHFTINQSGAINRQTITDEAITLVINNSNVRSRTVLDAK